MQNQNPTNNIRRLCVFCGSNRGVRADYAAAAHELAAGLVSRRIELVYGGGSVGLMGILADRVLQLGGHVIGVIPQALVDLEVGHQSLSDLRIVGSMHERKRLMADLADGFIAMPGGWGTLEEIFEVLTWTQLGLHNKPCGLLNVAGYFDALLTFLDHSMDEGFVSPQHRQLLQVENSVEALLPRLRNHLPRTIDKWIDRTQP